MDETLASTGEFGAIERITDGLRQPASTLLGPGDDAAVVAAASGSVVACTDTIVESVDFRLDWSSPQQVGRKAAAINLADISAMGAVPTALLATLSAPAETELAVLEGIGAGMAEEAANLGAGLVGGDLSSANQLVISVTALGDLEGRAAVTRSGARPGNVVAVAGKLGWSAAGFAVLSRGFRAPGAVVNVHRCPQPPYAEGQRAAAAGATAMTDVSDGLLADLGHIAAASGVAIDLRAEALTPDDRLIEVGSALGADPMSWVLTGGEDHALAATFAVAAAVPEQWLIIGEVTEGSGVTVDGAEYEGAQGWQHYR
ncbi:thiamine-phosphate kinase [Sciscionella sediminilitoris]|uniref:thiamine-phosphate kinase n=1 Tax=Sciscionella sediminilitoris TaxID=1445613 RepID=UPI0004DF8AB6|nr:thiamine-phosphate kinase [Sciscionella sp. SE31]